MQLMSQKYWCEMDEKRKHSKTRQIMTYPNVVHATPDPGKIPIQVEFENKPWRITLIKAYLIIIDSAMSNGMWTKV